MTDLSLNGVSLLPRCDVCGVEYIESYEGPCQETRGRWLDAEHRWSLPPCPGRVSWRATAETLYEIKEAVNG